VDLLLKFMIDLIQEFESKEMITDQILSPLLRSASGTTCPFTNVPFVDPRSLTRNLVAPSIGSAQIWA
jgi:hypothetical protein